MRPVGLLIMAVTLLGCGANRPPRTAYPGSVVDAYFCGLRLLEAEGYELQTERQQTDPDARIAVLVNQSNGVYLFVGQAGMQQVYVEVRSAHPGASFMHNEMLTQRVLRECTG